MLKGIFLNGLRDEIQAELKLHSSESLAGLMDRALLLEEKISALRKGGLAIEEKKGWRDKDGGMGRSRRDFFRSKTVTPRIEFPGKESGEGKNPEGRGWRRKHMELEN